MIDFNKKAQDGIDSNLMYEMVLERHIEGNNDLDKLISSASPSVLADTSNRKIHGDLLEYQYGASDAWWMDDIVTVHDYISQGWVFLLMTCVAGVGMFALGVLTGNGIKWGMTFAMLAVLSCLIYGAIFLFLLGLCDPCHRFTENQVYDRVLRNVRWLDWLSHNKSVSTEDTEIIVRLAENIYQYKYDESFYEALVVVEDMWFKYNME